MVFLLWYSRYHNCCWTKLHKHSSYFFTFEWAKQNLSSTFHLQTEIKKLIHVGTKLCPVKWSRRLSITAPIALHASITYHCKVSSHNKNSENDLSYIFLLFAKIISWKEKTWSHLVNFCTYFYIFRYIVKVTQFLFSLFLFYIVNDDGLSLRFFGPPWVVLQALGGAMWIEIL